MTTKKADTTAPAEPERLTLSKRIDASKRVVKALGSLTEPQLRAAMAFVGGTLTDGTFEAVASAIGSLNRLHPEDRKSVAGYVGALVGEGAAQ
jgi:hypothetical protein